MSYKKLMFEDDSVSKSGLRLNKYLSDSGVCSRRDADRMIADGQITVNGKKAVMGQKIFAGDRVFYMGKEVKLEEERILLAFHKPVGIECTTDRGCKDNIIDFLHYEKKIFYVGRLDKNSCGLILMTNDGDLANRIAKAVNRHEKEYVVTVNKSITEDFLMKMQNGVRILDTVTRPCTIKKMDDKTFRIILTQGLNRQIRRMCEALNYRVVTLKRVRIMNILLGNLKEGTYRPVTPEEEKILLQSLR